MFIAITIASVTVLVAAVLYMHATLHRSTTLTAAMQTYVDFKDIAIPKGECKYLQSQGDPHLYIQYFPRTTQLLHNSASGH